MRNDVLIGGPRADRLFGGDGNDRFRILAGGIDTLDGGRGNDTLETGDADDVALSVEVVAK
jgi:Ca2+-binding RTX toxin-like protein